jgi:hypothetical protein
MKGAHSTLDMAAPLKNPQKTMNQQECRLQEALDEANLKIFALQTEIRYPTALRFYEDQVKLLDAETTALKKFKNIVAKLHSHREA